MHYDENSTKWNTIEQNCTVQKYVKTKNLCVEVQSKTMIQHTSVYGFQRKWSLEGNCFKWQGEKSKVITWSFMLRSWKKRRKKAQSKWESWFCRTAWMRQWHPWTTYRGCLFDGVRMKNVLQDREWVGLVCTTR